MQNHASLVTVGRIIAFSLTALGSLSLSMADELSISLFIRLRSNANALNRSAERCERMLNEARTAAPAPEPAPRPGPGFDEAEVRAAVAEAQQRAAEASRPHTPLAPAPVPTAVPAAAPQPAAGKQTYTSPWAAAMAEVAAEELAVVARLPPSQRQTATARAAILSSTASQLLTGAAVPRLRPGDLAGIMQPFKR